MKTTIRILKGDIVQQTTADERWYIKSDGNNVIKSPSITWIACYCPKGKYFENWLAKKGLEESEAIKKAAAEKGSKIHFAITKLLKGQTIKLEDKILNQETGQEEDITAEEYVALMSFVDWYNQTKPKIISNERNVFGEKFAGTLDLICEIDGEQWIIDFKSGKEIYQNHFVQLAGYNLLMDGKFKLAILQVGYTRNKRRWKFTPIEYHPELFHAAYTFWEKDPNRQKQPSQIDLPLQLNLTN